MPGAALQLCGHGPIRSVPALHGDVAELHVAGDLRNKEKEGHEWGMSFASISNFDICVLTQNSSTSGILARNAA